MLPKTKEQLTVSELFASERRYTFNDIISYEVNTGYVVPHRNVSKLKKRKCTNTNPMIWSEAMLCTGRFSSDSKSLTHSEKWYQSESKSGLITEPCILIKRTSSKEQPRRIHAAIVSQKYIDLHGGFYAENHLNVMRKTGSTLITLSAVLKLLQTRLFDQLFRCINGTVTVSSSELNQILSPSPEAFKEFSLTIKDSYDADTIEQAARVAYDYDQIFEYNFKRLERAK
ncbi:MAG: hypothetical protein Q9N32_01405 [Gammaproteobacteria bacterium]|nr:hypothetical protein [Gammaproteobacteria bacterium]